jgi:hypothetical protein
MKMLGADLNRANVRQRSQAGRSLSYIESWHAIAEANRIFGFDGWNTETVDIRAVMERERKVGAKQLPGWGVTYVARVRVSVYAGERGWIAREGVGSGHGIDVDLGQAHESAIKEAESDARKRALMTFGNQFGLALYDKEQRNVSDNPEAGEEPAQPSPPAKPTTSQKAAAAVKQPMSARTEPVLDEIPHMEPKEAPTQQPTEQSNSGADVQKPHRTRSIADAIPAVPPLAPKPAKKPEPDAAQSAVVVAPLIQWLQSKVMALQRRPADAAKIAGQYEEWKQDARGAWPELAPLDRRRLEQERARLDAELKKAGGKAATAAAHDPETGEIMEAAE